MGLQDSPQVVVGLYASDEFLYTTPHYCYSPRWGDAEEGKSLTTGCSLRKILILLLNRKAWLCSLARIYKIIKGFIMNLAHNTLLWITLVVLMIVSGCAPAGKASSSWLGKPEGELLAAMGKPDNTANLPDGRKVLTWNQYESSIQTVPCRNSYTIGLDGNVEEFVASGCGANPISPATRRMPRGF
jgi:hypothetical protein